MTKNSNDKSNFSVLLGAAFLMATSAIGSGFMTQTAQFTSEQKGSFGFVILSATIMALIAQLNVWRVLCVSNLRGQDVANKVLPGLRYFIAFLVALGGFAFNIGNVGGAALGMQVVTGIDMKIAAIISAAIGIVIFTSKTAASIMDKLTQVLGALMILLIGFVAIKTNPPVVEAVTRTFIPEQIKAISIVTLVWGTVGGYIVFSGGHRVIDAGITG